MPLKLFWLFIKKTLIILVILLFAKDSFSQMPWDWGLKKTAQRSYQFIADRHLLATRAKYSSKGIRSLVFTNVYNFNNINLSINQLDPLDYTNWRYTQGIQIMRDTMSGASPQNIFLFGSNTNYAVDFETDANDNYLVLAGIKGNSWNPVNPVSSPYTDSTQILLCKVTLANMILWYKTFGGTSSEYPIAIKKTSDGNFMVLGQTQSNDGDVTGYNGGKDIWLLKISNTDGSIIWKKTIGTGTDEIPSDMEILNDGSIVISGSAYASTLFPSSYAGLNSFLLKTDAGGNMIWSKTFGGNGADKINAFVPISNGGYVSIGSSTSSGGDYPVNAGGSDVYIFRHNSTGDIVWSKQYGFADNDIAGDIAFVSCDSTIYASWSREFGGPLQPFSNYPPYCQNGGIRVGLQSNGTQSYYYQENMNYYGGTNCNTIEPFNNFQTQSIVSNNRGGILSLSSPHARWDNSSGPLYACKVTRSFEMHEYGFTLKLNNFDTSICKGQVAWGTIYNTDSTYSDTLRNACGIDTLISKYNIHVIDGDSSITRNNTVCYGSIYNGVPVYTSFVEKDTVTVSTICGPKLIITTTNVNVAPSIINPFVKDTTVCKDQAVQLIAYSPASSYLWQDGATSQTYNAINPGLYWVEVTDIYGCKKRDSMILSNKDLFLITPAQVTIQLPQTATLTPQTNGLILWDFHPTLSCTVCQTTVANPTVTQVYTLSSRKDGCVLSASIKVIVNKNYYLYIPTAFTPNDNGNNDIYMVSTNLTGYFKMTLYNRYGEKVFETTDPNKGWDGNYKGAKQPVGAYTYVVIYDSNFTVPQLEKGSFILIR